MLQKSQFLAKKIYWFFNELILRRKFQGQIVMEFENSKNEVFEIQFKDIQRIEKDQNSENGLKITLHRYFDSEFYLKTDDRKKLMNEIKKYWKMFVENKERKLTNDDGQKNEASNGYFDSIKKIIFGN